MAKYGYIATISADTSGLTAALKKSDEVLRSANNELKEINKALKLDPSNVELTSQKYTILKQQLEATRIRMVALEQSQKEAAKSLSDEDYRAYNRELENTRIKVSQLEKETKQLSGVTDQSSQAFRKAVESTKEYQQAMDKLSASAGDLKNKVGGALNEIWDIALKVGTAITSAAVAAGAASTKIGADFDASMSNVAALSGAVGNELDTLREKAKEMGATTSRTAKDSADALGYMALAGWDTQQMLEGLEPILRASEAGSMDLATASDLVTDSMSAMGISVNDLTHYLDVVTKAQSSSNASLEEFLNAYVVAGNTFKNFNVQLDESATLLGILANQGIKGSEAGNALNSVLINLVGANKNAASAMDALGVSAYTTEGEFIGITKTLELVAKSLENVSEQDKAIFTAKIGGKTQYDTLQALLSGVNEEYDSLYGKILDSNGALEDTAKIMRDNLKGDVTALTSALEGLGIEVNDNFTEAFREAVQVATKEVAKLSNVVSEGELGESLKKIAEAFAKVIEQIVKFAANTGIPAVVKFFEFIADNGEFVKSLIVGIGGAFVAWKFGSQLIDIYKSFMKFKEAAVQSEIAAKAFNNTLKANIILAAASAIWAAVNALTGFVKNAYAANDRISEYKKGIEELNEEVERFAENTQKSISRSEAEIAVIEDKARRYEKLRQIENRTIEEEEELKDKAIELQQYMPDNIQLIDEQTGAYNSLAGSIDGVIASMQKNAYIQAYTNEITEITTAQIEAKNALKDFQKQFDELDKELKSKGAYEVEGIIYAPDNGEGWDMLSDMYKWQEYKDLIEQTEESIVNYDLQIQELGKNVEQVYSDFSKKTGETYGESYAEYMTRIGKENDEKWKKISEKTAEEISQEAADVLAAFQQEMTDLDYRKNIHDFADDTEYWNERRQVLNKYLLRESEEWWKYYDETEEYFEKFAEEQKKVSEDLETERVNAIKASWDKITAMKDRGEIDEEAEYKAKAQIVKKYCDENEATWDSYYKWLYDYSSKKEKEIADNRLKAWEDSSKELSDTLAKSYKDLKSQKEQVKKDLESISLTETIKDSSGNEILGIKSLDAEIERIDKLKASRDKLKETGISESLMAEIDKMSFADGSRQRYIDELLGLDPAVLQDYYSDWEELQKKREEFAEDAVSDKLDELNSQTRDTVKEIFGDIPAEAYDEGVKTAQQYLQGIIDNMDGLGNGAAISSILNTANRTAVRNDPEASKVEKMLAAGTLITASTPININLNDKAYIKTTIGELINQGKRTGGNAFGI